VVVQEKIVFVKTHGSVERRLRLRDARDVVDMCMREQDLLNVETVIANSRQQLVRFVARIDEHTFARPLAADDKAVFVEWWNRADFDNHRRRSKTTCNLYPITFMIVCVIDDLIFSIKISTAAKSLARPCSSSAMPTTSWRASETRALARDP
jgi:hypothetical protein